MDKKWGECIGNIGPTEEICDGLSYGLAKNIVDTLFNKIDVERPIVFSGGVSKNLAVKKHISELNVGIRESVKEAGAYWDSKKKCWKLSFRLVYQLGLEKRIIDELEHLE